MEFEVATGLENPHEFRFPQCPLQLLEEGVCQNAFDDMVGVLQYTVPLTSGEEMPPPPPLSSSEL